MIKFDEFLMQELYDTLYLGTLANFVSALTLDIFGYIREQRELSWEYEIFLFNKNRTIREIQIDIH